MIDERLVEEALHRVGTADFEKFCQGFYSAMQDRDYIPLGGIHDGGADGFVDTFEDEGQANFIQISKQKTYEQKIRTTVSRLREYGRDPKIITLISSIVIPDIDKIQSKLSGQLGLKVQIRDANFIKANINTSSQTRSAFHSYLEPSIEYLYKPGAVGESAPEFASIDRTLAVFLRQEVLNRKGNVKLIEAVADSLIIWALRETDPEKQILMDKDGIVKKIISVLPSARAFINSNIDGRLTVLCRKDAPGGRQIRVYNKPKTAYCLPYETRRLVAVENANDDLLRYRVSCALEERAASADVELADRRGGEIAALCHRCLEKAFEHQGIEVTQFIAGDANEDDHPVDIGRIVADVCDELYATELEKERLRQVAIAVLRGVFYRSKLVEREYLSKVSRTYVLMLILKNEPKVVEYFSGMASNFNLYIGTDLIIRALSEHYLDAEDQATVTLFALLRSAGSRLILTEKALDEVASHIRRQIFEFENHYEFNEKYIPIEAVPHIDRLLIRAYFYAKLTPVDARRGPRSWRSYVEQFVSYSKVRARTGNDELQQYLCSKYSMDFEASADMLDGLDQNEIDDLTQKIFEMKNEDYEKDRVLALNDALHVLRVYRRRTEGRETNPKNQFGFKTWWLTQDSKVRRASADYVRKHGNARFMMRPEFLLNYIGLMPSLSAVRESYEAVFPSVLGVRLSAHLKDDAFRAVLHSARELAGVDDARAEALIKSYVQSLQADPNRRYS